MMTPDLTIADLDDALLRRLAHLAASHGRSLQAEARHILQRVAARPSRADRVALAEAIAAMTRPEPAP